jgi:uncharacterized protein (DUF362 family)/Pyruvate/2-oxoacid:ferredoxin oxidoreductase delta subunit
MSTVSLTHCDSYDADLSAALRALLEPLGGMAAFVSPGQTVLIKPNMLTDRDPEQAVTTHPALVRAVIRAVREAGGKPCVGDSPASAVKVERVMERTGFIALCREEHVPLIQFESAGSEAVENSGFAFNIAKPVRDADVIINMPKVKTHVLTTLTAAVKNTYGTIPGYQKALLHKRFANPHDFGKLMWAIYHSVRPSLNIADAIVGMEGHGPAGGQAVSLNFLAASANGVALDLALCGLLGIDPRSVPYLPPCIADASRIEPQLQDTNYGGIAVQPHSVALPSTLAARLIPRWLTRLLDPFIWIRPAINDDCIACGKCAKACPMDALAMQKGTQPELTPARCIGCCCCHEVCPAKAIEMTQSPLLNLIRRGNLP